MILYGIIRDHSCDYKKKWRVWVLLQNFEARFAGPRCCAWGGVPVISKLYPLLNFKNQNRSSLMFKTESLDWQQTCCNSSIRVRLGWTTAHSVFFQTSVFLWILCAQKCLPGSVQTWRFGRLLEWFGRILFGFQSHSRIRQAPCPMSHVNHVTILYHLEISEAKGVYGIKI